MKTINRWIIKDLLTSIAEGALLFTFIFLLKRIYELTDFFVGGGTTLFTTIKILCCILPTIMLLTFPMSILLASMLVYGRIAQDNELTALQAAGYTTRQLIVPALIIGSLLTGVLFWWGHRVAPKGLRLFDSLAANIMQDAASAGIVPGKFNPLGKFIIVPNTLDDNNVMYNVRMFESDKQRISTAIASATGAIKYSPHENSISLYLEEGNIFQTSLNNRCLGIRFHQFDFSIGISGLLQEIANVARTEYKATDSYLQSVIHRPIPPRTSKNNFAWWNRCNIEMARRTALPFACLIMAILGALLGIISGRGKRSSCYAMSITIIFIYYVMLNFGKNMVESQTVPAFLGLWIPNFLGIIMTAYLYYRSVRV